jgi:hypothetical protein
MRAKKSDGGFDDVHSGAVSLFVNGFEGRKSRKRSNRFFRLYDLPTLPTM